MLLQYHEFIMNPKRASSVIFAKICRCLIYADIPYICSRTSLAQTKGRSTNLLTKGERTNPAGGDAQLPRQLSAGLRITALCTWDQERNSNRKGAKAIDDEREMRKDREGETLKCAASVCRKLKLARGTAASRRCTLQAEQVGGGICIHMYVWERWRMSGMWDGNHNNHRCRRRRVDSANFRHARLCRKPKTTAGIRWN